MNLRFFKPSEVAFASALFIASPFSANAETQTHIQGKQYQPSQRECLKALESGNVLPLEATAHRAKAYVFYDGSVYLIVTGGGQVTCLAWNL